MMKKTKNRVVYSTGSGDLRKQDSTHSTPAVSRPAAQQDIRVLRDRKGRGGKTVTVARGFHLTEDDLKSLSKQLKALCGAGGAVKIEEDGTQTIEVQGDHRPKVLEKLTALGYKVKLAGG